MHLKIVNFQIDENMRHILVIIEIITEIAP